jgi:hypothetical protein
MLEDHQQIPTGAVMDPVSGNSISNVKAPRTLLALPSELRNEIFEMSLKMEDVIYVRYFQPIQQPPLTKVCRQIRHETLLVYFGVNNFHFKLSGREALCTEQFQKLIVAHTRNLNETHISFRVITERLTVRDDIKIVVKNGNLLGYKLLRRDYDRGGEWKDEDHLHISRGKALLDAQLAQNQEATLDLATFSALRKEIGKDS